MILLRDQIDAVYENLSNTPGLLTGCQPLDELTSGMYPGELILLSGVPGVGKSSFMEDVTLHVSTDGVPLIFSMEMGNQLVCGRLLAKKAQVSFKRMRDKTLSELEETHIAEAISRLKERRIFIEDRGLVTPRAVEDAIGEVEDRPDVVFIDHLQSMSLGERSGLSTRDTYTELSKQLKALAVRADVPIILLCHLNRGSFTRYRQNMWGPNPDVSRALSAARPEMTDLRETGALEQDADQIWFLFRKFCFNESAPLHEAEIIVAKRRNGPTGSRVIHWNPTLMSFQEPSTQMGEW